jgi:hypothetical protein
MWKNFKFRKLKNRIIRRREKFIGIKKRWTKIILKGYIKKKKKISWRNRLWNLKLAKGYFKN